MLPKTYTSFNNTNRELENNHLFPTKIVLRKSDDKKVLNLTVILKRPSSQNSNSHVLRKPLKLHVRFADETDAGPLTTVHHFEKECYHPEVPGFLLATVLMFVVLWNLLLQGLGFGRGLLQEKPKNIIKSISEPARNPHGHKRHYSRASLIRTNWDSGMIGLVNFRIKWVLQNTRREGGIGDSRALSSEGHNQGRVTM
jgi:hypothetical protein